MKKTYCDSCGADMPEIEKTRILYLEKDGVALNFNIYKILVKDKNGNWMETRDICDLCINETIRKSYESK